MKLLLFFNQPARSGNRQSLAREQVHPIFMAYLMQSVRTLHTA